MRRSGAVPLTGSFAAVREFAPPAAAVRVLPVAELSRSRGTRSRYSGVLLLLVVAIGFIVIRGTSQTGIAGRPSILPSPDPPAIGACLVLHPQAVARVPCTEPHSAEVVASWAPGVLPERLPAGAGPLGQPSFSVNRRLVGAPEDEICESWTDAYTGWAQLLDDQGLELWLPPKPLAVGRLISAPKDEGLADWHWTACVVTTSAPQFEGSLRHSASAIDQRPDIASVCVTPAENVVQFMSCDEPHSAELLGSIALTPDMLVQRRVSTQRSEKDVRAACLDFARQRMGTSDPSRGGKLEVVYESIWEQRGLTLSVPPPGWVIPDCIIRVTGSRSLVGSVVGVGDGDLPFERE
jgi:hypothetical protein